MFKMLMVFYRLPQGLAASCARALRPGTTTNTPLQMTLLAGKSRQLSGIGTKILFGKLGGLTYFLLRL